VIKLIKKPHVGSFFIIGNTKNKNNILIQQNLTSKKEINIDEECKIESTSKYELYKGTELAQHSYETPPIVTNVSLTDLKEINDRVFSDNDIRFIIKNKLYPNFAVNKLLIKSQDDLFYIDKNNKKPEAIIIKNNLILLEEIAKSEKNKGNIIFKKIDLLNE